MKVDKKIGRKIEMQSAISYRIIPCDLAGHLFRVTLTVQAPDPQGQILALPAWIPGSYMLREFARNIVQIRAETGSEGGAAQTGQAHLAGGGMPRPADRAL